MYNGIWISYNMRDGVWVRIEFDCKTLSIIYIYYLVRRFIFFFTWFVYEIQCIFSWLIHFCVILTRNYRTRWSMTEKTMERIAYARCVCVCACERGQTWNLCYSFHLKTMIFFLDLFFRWYIIGLHLDCFSINATIFFFWWSKSVQLE